MDGETDRAIGRLRKKMVRKIGERVGHEDRKNEDRKVGGKKSLERQVDRDK